MPYKLARGTITQFQNPNQGFNMIAYLALIISSILVGLVAVLLYRNKDSLDPKVFLTAALLNAGALLGYLIWRQRRNR